MRIFLIAFILAIVATVSIAGFRGSTSTRPPIEIFPDMDRQPKIHAQSRSAFFADGRTDRPNVPGTVPFITPYQETYTFLQPKDRFFEDLYFQTGRVLADEFGRGFPVDVTADLMHRGRDRYQIFCAVCHSPTGDGNGVTKALGMAATPTFHDDRIREMAEGEIFNTITHGKNQMGPYGAKLAVEDRWAVIAYVRALQRARTGSITDVPAAHRTELER